MRLPSTVTMISNCGKRKVENRFKTVRGQELRGCKKWKFYLWRFSMFHTAVYICDSSKVVSGMTDHEFKG